MCHFALKITAYETACKKALVLRSKCMLTPVFNSIDYPISLKFCTESFTTRVSTAYHYPEDNFNLTLTHLLNSKIARKNDQEETLKLLTVTF